jgi:hypothetical protein
MLWRVVGCCHLSSLRCGRKTAAGLYGKFADRVQFTRSVLHQPTSRTRNKNHCIRRWMGCWLLFVDSGKILIQNGRQSGDKTDKSMRALADDPGRRTGIVE